MTELLLLTAVVLILGGVLYAGSPQRLDIERGIKRWLRARREAEKFRAKYGADAPKILQQRIAAEADERFKAHLERMARFIGEPK